MGIVDVNKYITIDENGKAGQDGKTGMWYCKEVPFKDEEELDKKIGRINKILNKHNKAQEKKNAPKGNNK
jgi:hypothetical protein